MTDTLVDTNVLLDVAKEDVRWRVWSERRLAEAADSGSLLVNQVVYAELAVGYPGIEALNATLSSERFKRENVPWAAAFAAGLAFLEYRKRGGVRSSPLPDFFIGAHALVCGYHLLTRDRNYYATYFPALKMITPETHP